jgi:hypothetical protein
MVDPDSHSLRSFLRDDIWGWAIVLVLSVIPQARSACRDLLYVLRGPIPMHAQ